MDDKSNAKHIIRLLDDAIRDLDEVSTLCAESSVKWIVEEKHKIDSINDLLKLKTFSIKNTKDLSDSVSTDDYQFQDFESLIRHSYHNINTVAKELGFPDKKEYESESEYLDRVKGMIQKLLGDTSEKFKL